jgi:FdhD protein
VTQSKQPSLPAAKLSISESLENLSGVAQRAVRLRHSDSIGQDKLDYIADEVPIAFAYNGQSHAVMMASPLDLRDFAIGFSLTERVIDSVDDIVDIDIRKAAKGITIQLQIKAHLVKRLETQRRQLSGRSGCGICGITDIAAAVPNLSPLKRSVIPSHDVINKAVQTLQENQVLQNDCGAVHGAGLFTQSGDLLSLREDVGRHNALDKLIGSQVLNLESTHFVLMSSRASHELVNKTVIAGVGTLVAISAATTLAIEYAERTNLNLLGFIRGSRQVIYTSDATSA